MPSPKTFHARCLLAKDYILTSAHFENIYIGVFRSVNGLPDFYACNNVPWMEEYITKELWFVDPIVKDGLLTIESEKETLLSWTMSMTDSSFLEYRTAFIGHVKGFSKVLKHTFPNESETIVIGIGLYPEYISANKPLNVNAIFKAAEEKIQSFINLESTNYNVV
jgi:hypothetical protein